ncbi:hypothetical protein Tco_0379476 [Tanacetum coccineum]
MSSATSAVTYTSVYTDSEPGRAFWGADDEEVSEGGIPRVIVLGYDGLPIQPQPLPPIDSPTTESPGYVTESDPEEDPEEYEDDETEDGPVDYPMDGGDDGDDEDGDSSGDDANDEDEDEEDKEEEEHLAPADSTTIIPADEPVFPPEGTEPVIPPPSTDITIGARITVRPQTSISLPPEAEVERLLTMTTPSPSPPISLSPPSAGERLARCTAPPAHSPPLPPSSGDDIPESEQPPRKRLHLSTLGSRYEVGESSTARPTRDLRVDLLMGDRMTLQETVWMVEEEAYASREAWAHSIGLSQAIHQELQTHRDHVYAHETHLQAHQTQHQDQMVETLRVIRDMRREMSDMQVELLALQEQQRRAGQLGPKARIPDHQDASGDANSHI